MSVRRQFYRPREVAELLGIGLTTVYRHTQSGKIPTLPIRKTSGRDGRRGDSIRVPILELHKLIGTPPPAWAIEPQRTVEPPSERR